MAKPFALATVSTWAWAALGSWFFGALAWASWMPFCVARSWSIVFCDSVTCLGAGSLLAAYGVLPCASARGADATSARAVSPA